MADTEDEQLAKLGGVPVPAAVSPSPPLDPAITPDQGPSEDDALSKLGGVPVNAPAVSDHPEAPDRESDLGSAAVRGLKQLAPFLLDKEDLTQEHTGAETGVEIGTNIAADVALGAGIGALLGPAGVAAGAVTAATVHVAMAAFRGFGYEYAWSKAQGKDFDPMRGVLNTAVQINPLMGKGGRLMKAATQALLEAGSQAAMGASAEQAGVAGVVGGAIAGALHQNTGTWLAIMGQTAYRPGSNTDRGGASPAEMAGQLKLFADNSTSRMGTRIEQGMAAAESEDPSFFKLGTKLQDAEESVTKREEYTKAYQLVEEHGGVYPPKLAEDDQLLLKDVDGFKAWLIDQPGYRSADKELEGQFESAVKRMGDAQVSKAYEFYKINKIVIQETEGFNQEAAAGLLFKNKETGEVVNKMTVGKDVVKDQTKYSRVSHVQDPLQNGWVDKMTDALFVMRKFDRELGTNFEATINGFSTAKNKQNAVMSGYMESANDLVQRGRKVGLDNDTVGRWLAEKDINHERGFTRKLMVGSSSEGPGNTTINLSKDQMEVAEGWRTLFETVRQRLNNEGLTIDFEGGQEFTQGGRYLTARAKTGADAATSLRREAERLETKYGSDYLDHSESFSLRRTVGNMLGEDPENINHPVAVDRAIDGAINPTGKGKTTSGFDPGATFQRVQGLPVPEFIRDFDVGKLFTNYMNNNFKAVYYHDSFLQLNSQMEMLTALGMKKSAAYIAQYIKDISGSQSNFLAGITQQSNKWKNALVKLADKSEQLTTNYGGQIDHAGGGIAASAAKTISRLPDIAGFAISNIYPNYLGFNIRAALRDFTKPWLLTAPELGGVYGRATVAKAIFAAVHDKLEGGVDFSAALKKKGLLSKLDPFVTQLGDELTARGLTPGKHMGELGNISDASLRSVKGLGKTVEVLDWYNDKAMALYSQTDKMNRYITLKVAQQLARDLQAGHQGAFAAASRMLSEGTKSGIRDLGIKTMDDLKKVDVEKLGDILSAHLNAKTEFNYGKEGMNEFGRGMGRLFSMFTKWPAMMVSDAAEQYQKGANFGQGVGNVTKKYLMPMAVMSVVGRYVLDTKNNPYQRFLIGNNLAEWAPASSWTIGTPPVLQTAEDFSKQLKTAFDADKSAEEKMREASKFATSQVQTFMPGMALLQERRRFMKAFHPEGDR